MSHVAVTERSSTDNHRPRALHSLKSAPYVHYRPYTDEYKRTRNDLIRRERPDAPRSPASQKRLAWRPAQRGLEAVHASSCGCKRDCCDTLQGSPPELCRRRPSGRTFHDTRCHGLGRRLCPDSCFQEPTVRWFSRPEKLASSRGQREHRHVCGRLRAHQDSS